ncbi:MAG: hypothetical protein ACRDK2_14145 [Solirubrobacteraceae bacterium]
MSRLLATLALITTVALSADVALASSPNYLVGDCQRSQRQPSTVILTCADAGLSIQKITWSSFGGGTASGTGSAHINSCTPDCAAGKFGDYPVQITASKPKRCREGKSDYRQLKLTYTAKRPPGVSRSKSSQTYTLSCPIS